MNQEQQERAGANRAETRKSSPRPRLQQEWESYGGDESGDIESDERAESLLLAERRILTQAASSLS